MQKKKIIEKIRDTFYAARNAQALLDELHALRKMRAELAMAKLRERQYQRNAQRPEKETPDTDCDEDKSPKEDTEGIPVGRLDFLNFRGEVVESMEYTDEKKFLDAVKKENYYGTPMCITVYSDPVSGAHMDTSWVWDLDPLPQGFSISPRKKLSEQLTSEETEAAQG